jgi:hypothetical protein
MFIKRFTASVVLLACACSLGFAAAAGANTVPSGARTIQQFFPVAERLCTNVADGGGTARQRRNAAQVLADCAALETGFTNAHALFVQVESLDASIAGETPAASATCAGPATPAYATCVQSRAGAEALVKSLRAQRQSLNETAWADIAATRAAFWTAIDALPGARPAVARVRHAEHARGRRVEHARVKGGHC